MVLFDASAVRFWRFEGTRGRDFIDFKSGYTCMLGCQSLSCCALRRETLDLAQLRHAKPLVKSSNLRTASQDLIKHTTDTCCAKPPSLVRRSHCPQLLLSSFPWIFSTIATSGLVRTANNLRARPFDLQKFFELQVSKVKMTDPEKKERLSSEYMRSGPSSPTAPVLPTVNPSVEKTVHESPANKIHPAFYVM